MNSFNHYAFGAVGDWMYKTIGGITVDQPGGKHVRIAPRPGGGLTHARATLETLYGTVSSAWHLDGRRIVLNVTVPPNTSAAVVFGDTTVTVGSGSYEFTREP